SGLESRYDDRRSKSAKGGGTMEANGYAKPHVLVETAEIAGQVNNPAIRLVEVDVDTSAYDSGHIPGAIGWDWRRGPQAPPAPRRARHPHQGGMGGAAGARGNRQRHDGGALRRQQQLVRRLRLLALQALWPRRRAPDERRPQEVARRGARTHTRGAELPGR